ncbi:hypothetical protein ACFLQ9_00290 [Bacteroidota bacterium]
MKTLINKIPVFITIILLFKIELANCNAQESSNTTWKKTILLHYAFPVGSQNWEYSHPSFSPTGVEQTLIETGSFKSKSIFKGQYEISKGYFGFSAGAGIFPAEIKVDKDEVPYNFHSFFLEFDGLVFLIQNPTAKLVPLVEFGAGGALSFGDLDNTALFISFGGGLQTYFTKNLGLSIMLKGQHFTYNEIPLTESITGDIKFANFAFQLAAMYTF